MFSYFFKQAIGFLFCFFFCGFTIACALAAQMVR